MYLVGLYDSFRSSLVNIELLGISRHWTKATTKLNIHLEAIQTSFLSEGILVCQLWFVIGVTHTP